MVFIEFTSAYNMLSHKKLFTRLLRSLVRRKTRFLQTLNSKVPIVFEEEKIHPNQGVAQGSAISPVLFNIFSEALLYTLERKTDISLGCILMYAGNLLIICSDPIQIRIRYSNN